MTETRILSPERIASIRKHSGTGRAVEFLRSLKSEIDVEAATRFAFNGRIRWQLGRDGVRRAEVRFPFRSKRGRQMVLGVWAPWIPGVPILQTCREAARVACRKAGRHGFRFAEDAANVFEGHGWTTAEDPRITAEREAAIERWLMEGDEEDDFDDEDGAAGQ